jgi:hypothetical protein
VDLVDLVGDTGAVTTKVLTSAAPTDTYPYCPSGVLAGLSYTQRSSFLMNDKIYCDK